MPRFGQTTYGGPAVVAGGGGPAQSHVGSYAGDGAASRSFTLPFVPDLLVLSGNIRMCFAQNGVNLTVRSATNPASNDVSITSSPAGFTVTSSTMNQSSITYTWLALKGVSI